MQTIRRGHHWSPWQRTKRPTKQPVDRPRVLLVSHRLEGIKPRVLVFLFFGASSGSTGGASTTLKLPPSSVDYGNMQPCFTKNVSRRRSTVVFGGHRVRPLAKRWRRHRVESRRRAGSLVWWRFFFSFLCQRTFPSMPHCCLHFLGWGKRIDRTPSPDDSIDGSRRRRRLAVPHLKKKKTKTKVLCVYPPCVEIRPFALNWTQWFDDLSSVFPSLFRQNLLNLYTTSVHLIPVDKTKLTVSIYESKSDNGRPIITKWNSKSDFPRPRRDTPDNEHGTVVKKMVDFMLSSSFYRVLQRRPLCWWSPLLAPPKCPWKLTSYWPSTCIARLMRFH